MNFRFIAWSDVEVFERPSGTWFYYAAVDPGVNAGAITEGPSGAEATAVADPGLMRNAHEHSCRSLP